MKEEIKKIISQALKRTDGLRMPEISVEIPEDARHGDYASGVALGLAKQLKKNPMDVAAGIVSRIKDKKFIEKIEIARPGFINFYLSKEFFIAQLKNIDKNFGKNKNLHGEKVIVEYTDPNPFKEFHIGHLMSNAIGESIARWYEFQGAKVRRACYQGDVGLHVAKAIWGRLQTPDLDWGRAYASGAAMYEEKKEEINAINKKIYERSDEEINRLYEQGRGESLARFEEMYEKLGTKFDYYFFESETTDAGKKMVEDNVGAVFEKGDGGAIVFKGERDGLHTRVFVTALGLPTYEAKDLGLPEMKYRRFKYDKSIVITANEQTEYFKVMLAALKQISPELAEKTEHIG
ncbi:MAG: arginine--tRNA ligase, partial [Candidatus Saccharimonadales bacterium]